MRARMPSVVVAASAAFSLSLQVAAMALIPASSMARSIDLRQKARDTRTHIGVIFITRNEGDDGDETVEFISPCQRPHAGTLIKRQDFQQEIIERLGIDLDEFVTRVFFEEIGR